MGGFRLYFLLLIAVLLSGLAAMLPLAWTGADVLESSYREYAVRDMTANANLFSMVVAPLLDGEREPAGLSEVLRTAQGGSQTRFTIISRDGRVVADSEEDAGRMENHAGRPEVRRALAGAVGVDIRRSPTLGTEWIYAAVPMQNGMVARGAASLDEVNERLSLWWRRSALGFLVSLVVLVSLALLVARLVAKPLEVAAVGAGRYAKGDFSFRPPITGTAEMRTLADSLGGMAEELDSRFQLITRQREEMRVIFENMSEGVLAVDGGGRVMMLNRVAENILSLTADVAGKSLESVMRNAELQDAIRETRDSDKAVEKEVRVGNADGGESLVQVHAAPLREVGRAIGVVAVMRDITRLRQLEVMRRDFVANVSHELRTPVTTIQSSLETLLDGGMDDRAEAAAFLQMALKHTKRLGAIIGNLLLLSGMESGRSANKGKVAPHLVKPVLDEAISMCADEARERGDSIALSCDDGLTARMNPQLIVHALVNLLDNAIKYGPEAGVIKVIARANGNRTEIAVTDNGPGIAPRFHSRIFERFYRVDGLSRIKDGSGLGLAIVKHIAIAQDGAVGLESDIGAGSAFTLSLPRE